MRAHYQQEERSHRPRRTNEHGDLGSYVAISKSSKVLILAAKRQEAQQLEQELSEEKPTPVQLSELERKH
eukprot:3739216-Pyramimonas_sp.AAC.1